MGREEEREDGNNTNYQNEIKMKWCVQLRAESYIRLNQNYLLCYAHH